MLSCVSIQGTYGTVYCAKDKTLPENDPDKLVALKRVRILVEDEGIPSTAMREIAILKRLRHPNIVNLKDAILDHDTSTLWMCFEYLHTGECILYLRKMRKGILAGETWILLRVWVRPRGTKRRQLEF